MHVHVSFAELVTAFTIILKILSHIGACVNYTYMCVYVCVHVCMNIHVHLHIHVCVHHHIRHVGFA